MGRLGATRRRQSSSFASSDPDSVHIQPLQIARFCRGFPQIWKGLETMGSYIDKNKFDQGHEQKQVRENDKRGYYDMEIWNDTRGESEYFYTSEEPFPDS